MPPLVFSNSAGETAVARRRRRRSALLRFLASASVLAAAVLAVHAGWSSPPSVESTQGLLPPARLEPFHDQRLPVGPRNRDATTPSEAALHLEPFESSRSQVPTDYEQSIGKRTGTAVLRP